MTPDMDNIANHKVDEIRQACREGDLELLSQLASTEGGLLQDGLRRDAWPLLLGSRSPGSKEVGEIGKAEGQAPSTDWRSLPPHKDEEQVRLDVDRAFVYYSGPTGTRHDDEKSVPDGSTRSEGTKDHLKTLLNDLIISTLRRYPSLNYFQGYHDIAQVFLLVFYDPSDPTSSVALASEPLVRLSLLRIRDFMLPTMTGTTSHLSLLGPILHAADRELHSTLSAADLHSQPFFALSSTLTMYAHDMQSYASIARIFDFLLASDAVLSVYMYAAIVLTRKRDLQAANDDDDPAVLYAILSHLPPDLDLERLIADTRDLYVAHPPQTLPGWAWRCISPYSVLKTTRPVGRLRDQTTGMGESWMRSHREEIGRLERRREEERKLRELVARYAGRVSTGILLAVLIGGIAVYLGRGNGTDGPSRLATVMSSRVRTWGRHLIDGLVSLSATF